MVHPTASQAGAGGASPPRRRLLVISYHFPPDPAIGGMRWAGLAKYLARAGWEVWVVTAAPTPATLDGMTVASCRPGRTLNDLYVRWRALTRGGQAPSAPGGTAARNQSLEPQGLVARLRAEAAALLVLASEGQGWALRAAWRARRLIACVRPDVVVSSSPPVAGHLAAWLATRGHRGIRWLVDFRDPWAGPVSSGFVGHPYFRSHLAWALTVRLERLVVNAADGVITTTPELGEALQRRYPRAAVHWVRNGADREALPSGTAAAFPGLGIAQVGSLYGGRDLTLVLRALRLFLDRHPEAAADGTRLRSAGPLEPARAQALAREIAALDLGRYVEFLGVIPRPAALDLVRSSSLVVVLAQNQESEIPAKLYEALSVGAPTAAVASRDSATGREAERLGVALVEPDDIAAMARVLEAVWSDGGATLRSRQGSVDYRDLARSVASLLSGDRSRADQQRPGTAT